MEQRTMLRHLQVVFPAQYSLLALQHMILAFRHILQAVCYRQIPVWRANHTIKTNDSSRTATNCGTIVSKGIGTTVGSTNIATSSGVLKRQIEPADSNRNSSPTKQKRAPESNILRIALLNKLFKESDDFRFSKVLTESRSWPRCSKQCRRKCFH